MTLSLPARPSLDQLRKQAYELQQAARAEGRTLSLADAYHELAQRYGFDSWPKLKALVESTRVPVGYREAVEQGDVAVVNRFLDAQPALAEARFHDSDGKSHGQGRWATALCTAICHGRAEVATLLLEHGADANATGGIRSPLHLAIEHCDALIEPLLKHGATIDFAAAANLGRLDLLERMIEQDPAIVQANPTGSPPLEWAAWGGHIDVARVMIRHGADPEEQGAHGPAIKMDHREMLRLLLDHTADPVRLINTRRLLHSAVQMANTHDNRATIELLLARGADPAVRDEQDCTPLDLALELRRDPLDPWGHVSPEVVAGWLDGVILTLRNAGKAPA